MSRGPQHVDEVLVVMMCIPGRRVDGVHEVLSWHQLDETVWLVERREVWVQAGVVPGVGLDIGGAAVLVLRIDPALRGGTHRLRVVQQEALPGRARSASAPGCPTAVRSIFSQSDHCVLLVRADW